MDSFVLDDIDVTSRTSRQDRKIDESCTTVQNQHQEMGASLEK